MRTAMVAAGALALCSITCVAGPLRVALLGFDDATGSKPDPALVGTVDHGSLAEKGTDLLSKALLAQGSFVLIDRRDFISGVTRYTPKEIAEGLPRPSFIRAAQLLNADAVLGGSLASLSTGKQKVNQGGFQTELTVLSLRLTLRALDSVDGSVIAVANGTAQREFRQSEKVQTVLGEEDLLQMMEGALAQAVPELAQALTKRAGSAARPKVIVGIDATDNPAIVEIDGVLVGTTPITDLAVYQGDHTLRVSRPGYETIGKRVVLDRNLQIRVPMFRSNLSAEEKKALFEKADVKVFLTNGKPDILIHELAN
jgi:hypothetical protein